MLGSALSGRGVLWFVRAALAGGVFGALGAASGHPPARAPRWLPGFGWAAASPVLLAFAPALVAASAGFVLMPWAEHTFAYVPL